MNLRRLPLELLVLATLLATGLAFAHADDGSEHGPPAFREHVRILDFEGPIGSVMSAYVDRQATQAYDDGVDCLVLRIDSPGGTVRDSMKIADRLLEVPNSIHVVAWIPKEAYSGAAMVALGCDEIVMRPDAHFGDVQPGMQNQEGWQPAGEKIETVLRAKLRSYAERNGYPPALAESMVSARNEVRQVRDPEGNNYFVRGKDFSELQPDDEVVPGVRRRDLVQVGPPVVREDELLTMTGEEASRYGFLARTYGDDRRFPESEEELLDVLKAPGAKVEEVKLSFSEKASKFLLGVSGLLSAIVALAILFTMWQGPGTTTIIGGVALVLVVLINLTADQLNGFPLLLVAVGVLLLAAEVFVIPGFGIAGFLGIASLGAGFLFLAAGATFDDTTSVTGEFVVDFGLQFVLTVLLGMGVIFALSRLLPSVGPARRMVLAAPGGPPVTVTAATSTPVVVGMQGVAVSALRPAGSAEIEGRLVDVSTDGSWVPAGATVEVTAVEGNHVAVASLDPPDEDEA